MDLTGNYNVEKDSSYKLSRCLLLHNSPLYFVIDLFRSPDSGILLQHSAKAITKIDAILVRSLSRCLMTSLIAIK